MFDNRRHRIAAVTAGMLAAVALMLSYNPPRGAGAIYAAASYFAVVIFSLALALLVAFAVGVLLGLVGGDP